jgi:hypothetical protein
MISVTPRTILISFCLAAFVAGNRLTGDEWARLATYSTPCIYSPPDGPDELILLSRSHGLDSLDPKTGRQNWHVPADLLTPDLDRQ